MPAFPCGGPLAFGHLFVIWTLVHLPIGVLDFVQRIRDLVPADATRVHRWSAMRQSKNKDWQCKLQAKGSVNGRPMRPMGEQAAGHHHAGCAGAAAR